MTRTFLEGHLSYQVDGHDRHYRSLCLHLFSLGAVLLAITMTAPGQEAQDHDPSPSPSPNQSAAAASDPPAAAGSLATVQVTGVDETPADVEQEQLNTIPGGTSLVPSQQVEESRVATQADILKYQPGVFAQVAGGNDGLRISIRGSGVDRGTGFFRTGILFTFDGLPITGPSGTPFEFFDPLGLQYTEILRGTNAFDTGALELGGTINYATNTGYTSSPVEARFEAGSFGYYKGQVSSGYVAGPFDYYVSVDGSSRAGFQDHSNIDTTRFVVNLGYKINPNIETRFYVRYAWEELQQPGQLTREQIREDPTQANPYAAKYNADRIQPGSIWLGSKTTFILDPNSKLEVGATYMNFPIIIGGATSAVNRISSLWTYGNVSAQVKYARTDQIFNRETDTSLALYTSTDVYGDVHRFVEGAQIIGGVSYRKDQLFTVNNFTGSSDNVLLLSNNTELLPHLWLTTGVAGTFIRRNIDITYPVRYLYDKDRFSYLARFGLRYDITPDIQLYTNIGRSIEPRNDWAGILTPTFAPGLWKVLDLKEQTAWTTEVGVRFKWWIFQGNIDYFYSSVKDELLQITEPQFNNVTEANASPTTHQGVEIGLNTTLWQSGKWRDVGGPEHKVSLIQAYTYSDFYFNNDPVFGHNHLPGIPPHYYQAELRYDHASGFYVSFNVQAASSYPVDYADSFYTDSYVILGATVGYAQPKKGFEVYLDFTNLTNKHYAADVSPGYNDHGQDVARSDPGDGFGVFSGIQYKF
jgi:iron complex outermembrane recepter protein